MDEGWATTFEHLIARRTMGADRAVALVQQFRVSAWAHAASPLQDVPIVTPADLVRNPTYRSNAYGTAALGYLAVKDFLGDSAFRRAVHVYMDRWHGKHPTPWDFFATFDAASGTNLDWFWDNWYFSSGYIDLAIAG
jgi:aminopeptidase N